MPRQFPTGFREEMVRLMLKGEPVLTICSDTGVPSKPCIDGDTKPSLMRVLSMGSIRFRARRYTKRIKESSFLRKSYSS